MHNNRYENNNSSSSNTEQPNNSDDDDDKVSNFIAPVTPSQDYCKDNEKKKYTEIGFLQIKLYSH